MSAVVPHPLTLPRLPTHLCQGELSGVVKLSMARKCSFIKANRRGGRLLKLITPRSRSKHGPSSVSHGPAPRCCHVPVERDWEQGGVRLAVLKQWNGCFFFCRLCTRTKSQTKAPQLSRWWMQTGYLNAAISRSFYLYMKLSKLCRSVLLTRLRRREWRLLLTWLRTM